MARSSQQKKKVLYVAKALLEQTDREHPMSAAALVRYLHDAGIPAERKAIYDDIEELKSFGFCIESRRSKPAGFYIARRDFELGELRLMADAIRSAAFISGDKAELLIRKLENLAGTHAAPYLRQELFVEKRPNAMDEEIYARVDVIREAQEKDCQVSFQYLEWTVKKTLQLKRNGERYQVSPWGVIWSEGNYYLVAIDERSHIVKHYRVDKMTSLRKETAARTGHEMFAGFDVSEFASRTFGMFGGREETVTLEAADHLIGVLMDRFGHNVRIIPRDNGHFRALLRVNVSRQFFGWLAGLGPDVEIIQSKRTRFEYDRFLRKALERYRIVSEEAI